MSNFFVGVMLGACLGFVVEAWASENFYQDSVKTTYQQCMTKKPSGYDCAYVGEYKSFKVEK